MSSGLESGSAIVYGFGFCAEGFCGGNLSAIGERRAGDVAERFRELSAKGTRPTILTGVGAAGGNSEYLLTVGDEVLAVEAKGGFGIVGVDIRLLASIFCRASASFPSDSDWPLFWVDSAE